MKKYRIKAKSYMIDNITMYNIQKRVLGILWCHVPNTFTTNYVEIREDLKKINENGGVFDSVTFYYD